MMVLQELLININLDNRVMWEYVTSAIVTATA